MKDLKTNKGFTLIELLAVIVVLSVVIAIGTTAVLPMVNNIKKGAFVDEANIFKEAASNFLNIVESGGIEEPKEMSEDFQKANGKYCISLKYLVDVELIDKDPNYFRGSDHEYDGKIIINAQNDGTLSRYSYTITMHNAEYYINNVTGTVENKDVQDYKNSGSFTCSSSDVA